jgi:hypothetical protein
MRVGVHLAFALARLNHRHADTVLDAVQRIEEFALGEHRRLPGRHQTVDPNHRRVADRDSHIVEGTITRHRFHPKSGWRSECRVIGRSLQINLKKSDCPH